MAQTDVFRPAHEPARSIYDAFQAEAALRPGRHFLKWSRAEIEAVWRAARDYAQMHGRRIPTLEEIERAESYAQGSADYGLQWAIQVAALLKPAALPQTEHQEQVS